MWTAIFAILQAISSALRTLEKLTPTRRESQIEKIRKEKQRERQSIDDWIDRGGPSRR